MNWFKIYRLAITSRFLKKCCFEEVELVHFFRLSIFSLLRYNKTFFMKQLSNLYTTNEHLTGIILRIALALVTFPHGCQLFLGWFGGFGFSGSMAYFTQMEKLPWIVGFAVILLQFFGALFILFGFMGRFFAFAMTILFIGMVATNHWQYGFFMNWMGDQKGEGFEFHLLAIGISIAILASGSGSYSVDAMLSRKAKIKQPFFDHVNIYQ